MTKAGFGIGYNQNQCPILVLLVEPKPFLPNFFIFIYYLILFFYVFLLLGKFSVLERL